mgnify:FL=1
MNKKVVDFEGFVDAMKAISDANNKITVSITGHRIQFNGTINMTEFIEEERRISINSDDMEIVIDKDEEWNVEYDEVYDAYHLVSGETAYIFCL